METGDDQEWYLPDLLVKLGLADTKSEARRLVSGGAIRLDGQALTDPNATIPVEALVGRVIQRAKRGFVRLILPMWTSARPRSPRPD
ncbi:MAG: S4 domain-containing protein, partial [Actinomycetota bacterium]